jgi:fructose-bisphosphate aldolase class 1
VINGAKPADDAELISGVIMYDETIRQKSSGGAPFAQALTLQHIVPGLRSTLAQSLLPAL